MHDDLEERALADAAKRGDEHAWRVLFARHADPAYRYAYVRTGRRRERAEEAVQEAWMIAVRRLSDFDPARGNFGAWLQGILMRVLANEHRRWALRDGTEVELGEHVMRGGPAIDDRLSLAFTELPVDYQDVIRAKYLDGESMNEIAGRWKRTPKAIESLLGRARAALRAAYMKLDDEKDRKP